MVPDEAAVSAALAQLQKTTTPDGDSLYDTLTHMLEQVLESNLRNPVDLLETALLQKKAAGLRTRGDDALAGPAPSVSDTARCVQQATLYGPTDVPIDPETGEPMQVEPPNEYECEDVLGDAAMFEALGIGLGRAEMMDVTRAVKRLGEDPRKGVATVRFFGKFLGTAADYYVYETTLKTPPEDDAAGGSGGGDERAGGSGSGSGDAPPEWNAGANGYVYFVASTPGGPLTQLPHVTPAQVKAARRLRRLLTGRLASSVSSYPLFPGCEANYLRAQIARISCTTVVCPAGLFVVNEEGGMESAEDFAQPPAREMGTPSAWSHRYPHLKRQGRCTVHRREAPEGEEESFPWTEEELEEGPPLLATLDADDDVDGGAAWTPLFSSVNEHVKNQVAGLRSNLWPGAACACQGSRFTNVYVGWGVKAGPFVPAPPPPVAREHEPLLESAELPLPARAGDADEGGDGGEGA